MKPVLMVSWLYPPAGGTSGVLRTLKFSKYLPASGWIPHVLTARTSLYYRKDETLLRDIPHEAQVHRTFAVDTGRHLSIRGRHPVSLAVPDRYVGWLPFAVPRGLRVIRQAGVRALYSTSPTPTAHLVAACLKAATGLPWVADFRDPWVEEGIHPPPGTWRSRLESALERQVLRRADRVSVTTPYMRGDFLARYPKLSADKVRVIYNGYDEEDFEGLDAPLRATRFEIVHAGLITQEFRNPLPLLRALASLIGDRLIPSRDAAITLLGAGAWIESAEFAGLIKTLGLESVVQVIRRVPHREALRRLAGSAALLLLQASEDTRSLIPAKAFEYLRINRPILALTLEGTTADLLKGMEHCHVLNPADEPGLRTTLLALYQLWQRSPEGVQVSRPIQRYSRRHLTGELAQLLDELTDETGRSPRGGR